MLLTSLRCTRARNNAIIRRPFFRSYSTQETVSAAVNLAEEAFDSYRKTPRAKVRDFLYSIATQLEATSQDLIQTAHKETHIPLLRLENELKRTTGQLRTFGEVAERGTWADPRIEIYSRSTLIPIGPVAVFGASNFPFAFSTAGGDTASALAARCPVVYKVHPGHIETSAIAYKAICKARDETGLHPGVFQSIEGDIPMAHQLVLHPSIKGVGFTGSQKAGRAILATSHTREEPIPVYAEMGSVNPVFFFPNALKEKSFELAKDLCHSATLGVGQFCTNPGLVFIIGEDELLVEFVSQYATQMSQVPCARMLTPSIFESYKAGLQTLQGYSDLGVRLEYATGSVDYESGAGPAVFSVSIQNFMKNAALLQTEIFGPSTLLIKCSSVKQLEKLHTVLEGQLCASFHGTEVDKKTPEVQHLLSTMSLRVGRMVWGGFPTGVAVNTSMQHGGPWPSSSDSRVTSVGTRAILRWARPLCYQDFPNDLLPQELQDPF